MLVEAPPMSVEDIVVPDQFQFDESQLEAVAYAVQELGDTHFVIGRVPSATFPWRETVGLEEFLVRMITQPEFVSKATAVHIKQLVAWAEAMCDLGVDAILEGSDYCDNRGTIMGPGRFRQFILPGLTELVQAVHAKGKYFIKHTDGNTWSILDDLVAAGVDGWQGIQPSIGMDLKLLKEKYAGKLCLFGGVNNDTLIAGTPTEVAEEVKYAIRYAAPGGGLVLTVGNTLQIGTRYENYMAMLAAAREFGQYPIHV
jgi:uroporphyrinogen decarboxylase